MVPNNLLPKGELICFGTGAKSSGALQKNFDRFRKTKREEIKFRNYVQKQTDIDRADPKRME